MADDLPASTDAPNPETPSTPLADASDATAAPAEGLSAAEADHRTDLPGEPEGDEPAAPLAARAPVSDENPAFADYDVNPEIVRALSDVGITRTFAIQELTLPIALAGNDLIGQARTGSGKTLGFGVPLLNRITLAGQGGGGAAGVGRGPHA